MYLANPILLTLGAIATVHASWTIPENQPDGTYLVTVDDAGNSHHEKVDSLPAAPAPERRASSAKFSPRAETYQISCFGYYLKHSGTNSAGSNLDSQCGSNVVVSGKKSFYEKFGNVVAYFCNNLSGSNTCYSWEVQDALVGKGPAVCGNYAALAVKFVEKGGTHGQQVVTASFC